MTLSVLGFTDINTPTVGTMIFWANQHSAMVAGVWWWFAFPTPSCTLAFIALFLRVSMNEHIDPRSRLARMGQGRDDGRRSATNGAAPGTPVLSVRNLRAYYQMRYFGIFREVRAVDDITLHVNRNEIWTCRRVELRQDLLRQDLPPPIARRSMSSAGRCGSAFSTAISSG